MILHCILICSTVNVTFGIETYFNEQFLYRLHLVLNSGQFLIIQSIKTLLHSLLMAKKPFNTKFFKKNLNLI